MRENDDEVPPIAHSVLSGEGMARLVRDHYGFDAAGGCHLLRGGYNEVYALDGGNGSHRIARLGALRARGPANIDYEISMLEHVLARGATVAEPVRPLSGAAGVAVTMPEGARWLTLFHRVEGDPPESDDDIALTGEGLARLHEAAADYDGPVSRYRYDVDHLLRRPLTWILRVPELDEPSRERFAASARAMESDFAELGALTRVPCHGDCHGGNNFIRTTGAGERESVFFDFDDAAPGYLAYDLAVLLWSQLLRNEDAGAVESVSADRSPYLGGYRRRRALADVDIEAVPLFVRMRHVLWVGERVSRRSQWGSGAFPERWLLEQVELLDRWRALRVTTS